MHNLMLIRIFTVSKEGQVMTSLYEHLLRSPLVFYVFYWTSAKEFTGILDLKFVIASGFFTLAFRDFFRSGHNWKYIARFILLFSVDSRHWTQCFMGFVITLGWRQVGRNTFGKREGVKWRFNNKIASHCYIYTYESKTEKFLPTTLKQ